MKTAAFSVFLILAGGVARADDVEYDKGLALRAHGEKGDFALRLQLRVESLWTMTSTEDEATGMDTTNARFSIERARLNLEGHAFTPKLEYKLQTDFGKGFLALKDFWFQGEVAPDVWIRAGQWKRPYSRQQINSSGKLEMTTRAITDKAFRGGRDLGVAIHDRYESSPELEWVLGVFNGTGDKPAFDGTSFTNVPVAWMPAIVGRVGYNHGGLKGYTEADLEGGPARFGVALSLYGEADFDRDSVRTHQAEVDGVVKVDGFAASAAVYGLTSAGAEQLGFHAQIGQVVGVGLRRFEPVARYAAVKAEGEPVTHEVMVGFGWLPYGHDVKVLVDAGVRGGEMLAQIGGYAGF